MVLRRLYAPWRRLRGGDLGELVHSGAGGVAFMEQVEKENEIKCEERRQETWCEAECSLACMHVQSGRGQKGVQCSALKSTGQERAESVCREVC
jgi:hypothetical protein